MPDTVLKLGSFTFRSATMEVPQFIPVGGEQVLVVHQLVGGARVVDAMGRSDAPLVWKGRFLGPDAADRALQLDAMRVAAKPLELTWGKYRYKVLIHRFIAETERFYNVPYEITCLIIEDLANPTAKSVSSSVDGAIRDGIGSANFFSDLVDDLGLTDIMNTVTEAAGAVQDFAAATVAEVNSVLAPVVAAQAYVQGAILQAGVNLGNITSLGGVIPNDVSASIYNLTNQAEGYADLGNLYNCGYGLGTVDINLRSLNGVTDQLGDAGSSLVTAGGNLFDIAGQVYGDATKWTGIAERNGLNDPQLDGINSLQLPDNPPDTGGILGA